MVTLFKLLCFLIFSQGVFAQGAAPQYAAQGWSSQERQRFYTTTQGSQLIPYDWFLALERPDSEVLFLEDNLARFGYLAGEAQPIGKPKSLPVGFVKDVGKRGWFVGMTCAACHTSEIQFGADTVRVDGAPTNADMFKFLKELGTALEKASNDDASFLRFSNRLPKPHAKLREKLAIFSDQFKQFVADSTPASPWGPARLDAFGMIFNRMTNKHLGHSANNRQPNAPVSYPFLWGTGIHDVTQWNGSAPNKLELHRLARNAGEVLGVFADFSFTKKTSPYWHYESSVNRLNLLQLDKLVNALRSPPWPGDLSPIDPVRAQRGATHYAAHCAGCHKGTAGSDGKLVLNMIPLDTIKTDDSMALTFEERKSKTQVLEGQDRYFFPSIDKFAADDFTRDILLNAVGGALISPMKLLDSSNFNLVNWLTNPLNIFFGTTLEIAPMLDALREAGIDLLSGNPLEILGMLFNSPKKPPSYKARPLEGIWATAPYLHNGSVPNLMELLTRPELRVPQFSVGSREFDFTNVGFASSLGTGSFVFDTSIPGNRNTGHEYGIDLNVEEKKDLIEFLKKL